MQNEYFFLQLQFSIEVLKELVTALLKELVTITQRERLIPINMARGTPKRREGI